MRRKLQKEAKGEILILIFKFTLMLILIFKFMLMLILILHIQTHAQTHTHTHIHIHTHTHKKWRNQHQKEKKRIRFELTTTTLEISAPNCQIRVPSSRMVPAGRVREGKFSHKQFVSASILTHLSPFLAADCSCKGDYRLHCPSYHCIISLQPKRNSSSPNSKLLLSDFVSLSPTQRSRVSQRCDLKQTSSRIPHYQIKHIITSSITSSHHHRITS